MNREIDPWPHGPLGRYSRNGKGLKNVHFFFETKQNSKMNNYAIEDDHSQPECDVAQPETKKKERNNYNSHNDNMHSRMDCKSSDENDSAENQSIIRKRPLKQCTTYIVYAAQPIITGIFVFLLFS